MTICCASSSRRRRASTWSRASCDRERASIYFAPCNAAFVSSHSIRLISRARNHQHVLGDDQLRDAVAQSINVAQVIRKLGLVPAGGNYDQVQRRMKELALDKSHFNQDAKAWSRGRTYVRKPI